MFAAGCANQLPPKGGEEDLIPPQIISTYPVPGTINFDDDYFEVEFSEYINKRSFQEALFISPYIDEALDFSWTGTTVTVTIPSGLKEDLTYTIAIGSDVVDLNNSNRMRESFSFSFATGNKIDRNAVAGQVYGSDKEGVLIFAYKLGINNDSLFNNKPDYVSQTGSDGRYELKGLASGNYRVFAVLDKFRDLKYQQEQDLIGIPFQDISLSDIDSIFTGMDFLLFNADTSTTRLVSSIMTDANHILVTFTSAVNQSMIYADNFTIIDSTTQQKISTDYAYKGKTKPEEMVLAIKNKLNTDNDYYLMIDSIISQTGSVFSNDFTAITFNDKPDTIKPKVIETTPSQNSSIDFIDTELTISFDDAISRKMISNFISLDDTLGNKININIEFDDDATIIIKPLNNLKPEKDYVLKIHTDKLEDAAGNRGDSVFTLRFKTISGLDFTGLSGQLLNVEISKNPIIVLTNFEDKDLKYHQALSTESFEFKRIEPGKYFLWCFLDKNNDNAYTNGYPQPIKFAEEFSFYPDTLELRPRWEITDVIFRYR